MNIFIALLLSIGIWVTQFLTFGYYIQTQNYLFQWIMIFFSMISMTLMTMALALIEKGDF